MIELHPLPPKNPPLLLHPHCVADKSLIFKASKCYLWFILWRRMRSVNKKTDFVYFLAKHLHKSQDIVKSYYM